MLYWIWDFLSTEGFQPHGMCLLWRPDVFWAHFGSDFVIAMSYFSIPAALVFFALRRSDLMYRWVLYLFGAFIVACGLTHVFGIWTMWVPDYGLEALVKVATAIVSAATAVALWPLMPKLLAIPSARLLEEKNAALAREIAERESAEAALHVLNDELESRVSERTLALERLNAELLLSRAQAEQANHAKDEFLAKMSHELRTPLNAIMGFSEIIRQEILGPVGKDEYCEYAKDIHESGQHLLALINDVLDLSKIDSGAEELHEDAINVPDLVRSIMTMVKRFADKNGVTLALDIPHDLPSLHADQRRVKQIFVNLLSNAIKFTPTGGEITVKARYRPDSGYIFRVIDTGIGIAAEDIPRALTPFQQIESEMNRKHEGTGLGLPLAKSFVEMHGGSLDLQSEVGTGTTATIRFPPHRGLPPVRVAGQM